MILYKVYLLNIPSREKILLGVIPERRDSIDHKGAMKVANDIFGFTKKEGDIFELQAMTIAF